MGGYLKDSFAIFGYVVGVIGTLITIFSVNGQIVIGIRWVILIGIVLLLAIVLTVVAILYLRRVVRNGTRYAITAYSAGRGEGQYYTAFSNNLRVGTVVSIYYSKPLSKRIGYGIVTNSSTDEYVEIDILCIDEEFKERFELSKSGDGVIRDMYILPNQYYDDIGRIKSLIDGSGEENE